MITPVAAAGFVIDIFKTSEKPIAIFEGDLAFFSIDNCGGPAPLIKNPAAGAAAKKKKGGGETFLLFHSRRKLTSGDYSSRRPRIHA
jgi:hypothetical protein